MKVLFLFSLMLLCGNVYALDCPDFRGTFQWTDELDEAAFIKISMTQTGCTFVQEEHDQGWGFTIKKKHTLDGQRRLVEDNGDFQAYETATIDSAGLHIMEERHLPDQETGKPTLEYMKIEITLPSESQMVISRVHYDAKMQPIEEDETIYTRQ